MLNVLRIHPCLQERGQRFAQKPFLSIRDDDEVSSDEEEVATRGGGERRRRRRWRARARRGVAVRTRRAGHVSALDRHHHFYIVDREEAALSVDRSFEPENEAKSLCTVRFVCLTINEHLRILRRTHWLKRPAVCLTRMSNAHNGDTDTWYSSGHAIERRQPQMRSTCDLQRPPLDPLE